jgi:predicted porin
MNKKLITLAVAAAMTAPAAALADATLYGKLNVSIDYFDVGDGYGGFEGWALNGGTDLPGAGRANRVGVKGSEDLGGGLKAIYQVEFGVPLANEQDYDINNGDVGGVSMRNTFVGLAGNWGTFVVGRHDTPMKISTGKLDMFADTMADFNGTVGFLDIRADNAIAYISPNFSGFQLAGAIVPGGESTASGAWNVDSDSIAEGYSIAAIYANGPFYGSVAYEGLEDQLTAVQVGPTLVVPDESLDQWRVGLGILDWNGFTLSGVYANLSQGDFDVDQWQVQAGYAFGNNQIMGAFGQDLPDDSDFDADTWAVGLQHNFSKRTRAYLLYTDYDEDNSDYFDWSGASLGMVHSF